MATIIADNDEVSFAMEPETRVPRHQSWNATLVGAVSAVSVTGLLLLLGVGLSVLSGPGSPAGNSGSLAEGLYLIIAYGTGFSIGGYVAGRLTDEGGTSSAEEGFRVVTQGLAVWSIAATIWMSAFAISRAETPKTDNALAPTSYWVNVLFRPQASNNRHASLDGVQFAQVDTGEATDGTTGAPPPVESQPNQPNGTEDFGNTQFPPGSTDQNEKPQVQRNILRHVPGDLAPAPQTPTEPTPEKLAADKSEVTGMMDTDMAQGGYLSVDDRDRAAQLIAQDANLSYEDATTRVNTVQARIRTQRDMASAIRRHEGAMASLWLAFALFVGAGASAFSALFAQRRHDLGSMMALIRSPR